MKDASSGKWIDFVSNGVYDPHKIDWEKSNATKPDSAVEEWWQFRITKSKGRVAGFLIDNVFFVYWFDPHHNLTNSVGYSNKDKLKYKPAKAECERLADENKKLIEENSKLKKSNELLDNLSSSDLSAIHELLNGL